MAEAHDSRKGQVRVVLVAEEEIRSLDGFIETDLKVFRGINSN